MAVRHGLRWILRVWGASFVNGKRQGASLQFEKLNRERRRREMRIAQRVVPKPRRFCAGWGG